MTASAMLRSTKTRRASTPNWPPSCGWPRKPIDLPRVTGAAATIAAASAHHASYHERRSITSVGARRLDAIAAAQFILEENLKFKPLSAKTPDGLMISAQQWGNPDGPEILFIHGFAQSHLSWVRQVDSELANEFNIVTYDFRGHGNSD